MGQRDSKSDRCRIVTVFLGLTGFIALTSVALPDVPREEAAKPYQIVDGKVDKRTYNGFRRYNAVRNHCQTALAAVSALPSSRRP